MCIYFIYKYYLITVNFFLSPNAKGTGIYDGMSGLRIGHSNPTPHLSRTHAHTNTLTISHTRSLTLTHALSLYLSHILSHSTCLSHYLPHYLSHTRSVSLYFSHPRTLTHSLLHSLPHSISRLQPLSGHLTFSLTPSLY